MAHKILIVDDEPELVELLEAEFRENGFEVLTASGGWEAKKIFEQNAVDVILSDVRMQKGGGLELLRAVNQQPSKVIFYFMTAYNDLTPIQIRQLAVEGVIRKPFSLNELVKRVDGRVNH